MGAENSKAAGKKTKEQEKNNNGGNGLASPAASSQASSSKGKGRGDSKGEAAAVNNSENNGSSSSKNNGIGAGGGTGGNNQQDQNSNNNESTGLNGKMQPRESEEDYSEEAGGTISFRNGETVPRLSADDFELLKVIGDGCFGKVMQVRRKDTGEIFAMKTIHKDHVIKNKKVVHTRTERNVMTKVRHPFVINLHCAFQTGGKLYLIMDYLAGGDLFYHLSREKKFSESRTRFYAAEVMLALECLHSFGYIYRDLKPENILLAADGHLCLTDFGLSKENFQEGTTVHTFVGTTEYLAPEVLTQDGYGKEVDWWSLGVLIYEMITGCPPFYSKNRHLTFKMILSAELRIPDYVSPTAQHLIRRLLVRNPKLRLGHGPQGSADVRAHPFFAALDLEALMRKEIEPPFVPATGDAVNFDPKFTDKAACDSPINSPPEPSSFTNFTYVKSDWIPPPGKEIEEEEGGAAGEGGAGGEGGKKTGEEEEVQDLDTGRRGSDVEDDTRNRTPTDVCQFEMESSE